MIIDVQHVTWKRGPITLLNDVSWRVNEGEHWALLGLNGSGKTTLLNMITGYLWPTEGTITVLGHRYGDVDLRELRKSIGWVSSSLQEKLYGTDFTQYVVISGKHATIGLYDKLSDEDLDQARELMRTLGCQHLWDREYRTCSQGEKQKLLIARALMANPRVLILDEPCNGLDLFSRERLLESISELTQKPDTPSLIYVTHHTEEILPVFSHSLLLRRGEIVNSGLTSELMNKDVLSNFFESPVDVDRHGERVYVRASEK
ncbi:MAG TPA: ABC transporter ATP-binding protein [Paenibacillus sp.]|uniref:ABC transporter ATP-binding protein n=1 Tax=Paenibacillus TaxID=44249 RepID=UPI000BA0D368|nr:MULTISPECIES: ABC transporter ATP-binding protein [Paenibacillus]OZQ63703.1 molybdenum ABC transporter ATP-binding protein [Paenibacillus taichungensis]HBU83795.1 ABC transporter ATP-binding protein [Paenibacillus sp.]